MKNSMQQKVFIAPQLNRETNERVLCQSYVNNTYFDTNLNRQVEEGVTRLFFVHKERKMNAITKRPVTKTRRVAVDLPTLDKSEVYDYITDMLDKDIVGQPVGNPQEWFEELIDNDVRIPIKDCRIIVQEFALTIKAYARGKHVEFLQACDNALARYNTSEVFRYNFEIVIRRAIRLVNDKLLLKLMDPTTGLFSPALIKTLDAATQASIAAAISEVLFGSKEVNGKLKRPNRKAPCLRTKAGEYILTCQLFCDNIEDADKYADIFIEHDKDNKETKEYLQSQRVARINNTLVEEEDKETEPVAGATANLPTGAEEEEK
jgi:hypothetical protein